MEFHNDLLVGVCPVLNPVCAVCACRNYILITITFFLFAIVMRLLSWVFSVVGSSDWYSVADISVVAVLFQSRKLYTDVSRVGGKVGKFGWLTGVVFEPYRIFDCLKRIESLCLIFYVFCWNKCHGAK